MATPESEVAILVLLTLLYRNAHRFQMIHIR